MSEQKSKKHKKIKIIKKIIIFKERKKIKNFKKIMIFKEFKKTMKFKIMMKLKKRKKIKKIIKAVITFFRHGVIFKIIKKQFEEWLHNTY